MKYLIVGKKGIFVFSMVLLAAVVVVAGFSHRAETASAQTEKIVPVYCVDTDEKKAAITFDAAWGADDTQRIIEILKKHNAKATVFTVGDWARKYPDSVKAFYEAGCEIGNHSDKHIRCHCITWLL